MKVLLAGNTGYVTKDFIEEAFPECQVMVIGNNMLKTVHKKEFIARPFPRTEQEFRDIFNTYEFEAVVYFSNYLTFHGELEGEAENLRKILQYCGKGSESHFLYVTGPEGMYDVPTGETLLAESAENVCRRYARMHNLRVKILRVPYLYSGIYKKDFFYRIFEAAKENQKLVFQEAPEQKAYFLYPIDLAGLIYKLYDNWNDEEEILNVPDVFGIRFQQMTEELKRVLSPVSIIYKNNSAIEKIKEDDKQIRINYNWFPKISVLDHISEMYEEYKENTKNSNEKINWFASFWNRSQKVVRVCEFVACFFVFELLQHLLGNQAQFEMIDLRLVFIVLFGSLYGLGYGIAGAAVQAVSLLLAYENQGTKWYTLFYEPTNWIPFIFYFATGAVCGYVRMKNKENLEFISEEKQLIREKFLFMRDLYQETFQDKRRYKKQILGSKDSFGKIFDITRKLDIVQPQELFIETMYIMETVLENESFAFYSLSQKSGYGRLEAASPKSQGMYASSIRLSEYTLAMDTLEKGQVWANREFVNGYPMYMAGIRREGSLVMLICIQEVKNEQLTLYYMNLFQILCGLVETSLLRALAYQEATEYKKYVEKTRILKTEYFEESLKLQNSMREQKMASYILLQLKFENMTIEEADEALDGCIRENDIRGISPEGELYLILTQADDKALPFILGRLERNGFTGKVMDAPVGKEAGEET